ncbi:MAG TPA: tRNA (N(6)-L-threonylcarbamoyladenosine(37)-C(2))-methylthiotransferase MtaB [Bacillota bacterium]|nr:tRNA (N(6)-L-threonylcarbamoyladenosine(37)-C(2))-methylthiotransferase MtaB [Bacillota bacterium]HOR86099.1 tRNA (N(6)-L-threonylcarbamoyladenosine(37)-C(2))-methylthiotransferase MtaB [Bacillota bacterium]HPL53874.1 tRNA (N(6)-L-threonylcarbamoyladenosine(37)-C(2))-methylthiotransferase MtaB [Bacillota bacterium]
MKRAAFYTLGCKVNQYETEAMIESFEDLGYKIVDYSEFADVYVINTCTVTNMGDRKSRQIIRRALDVNPDAFVTVAGCYSQMAPKEVSEIPGVSLVVGTGEKGRIAELIEYAKENEEKLNLVSDIMEVKEFEETRIKNYKDRTRAFLKIQEGCNQYCTYCIIPYARGRIRSRRPDSIIEEVKELAGNGFKEIVLTGIHVASYGKDLGDTSLIEIIERVHDIPVIERIRMSSVDPNAMTGEFIDRLRNLPKICRHFHLSLQSGCDETLKRMNRKYTTQEYKGLVERLREVFTDVAITTDLIVGFPGETEEEFQKTVDFIKDISFSAMHVFKYSPRKGTPASNYKGQVSPQVKDARSRLIVSIAKGNEEKYKKSFIGRKMKVLYERQIDDKSSVFEGLTDNYIRVESESRKDIKGKIVETALLELKEDHLTGKILNVY